MISSHDLRTLFEAERPFIEQAIELAEHFAEVRKAQSEKGLDWARAKVLFKAMIQDENDGGHRVEDITRGADTTSEYATLMNKKNFSSEASEPAAPNASGEAVPSQAPQPSGAASHLSPTAASEAPDLPAVGGEPVPDPENGVKRIRIVDGTGSLSRFDIPNDLSIPEFLRR